MTVPNLSRDPCWCHECGTYSFIEEWGEKYGQPDVCPACGEVFPAMHGPLLVDDTPEALARAYLAASRREVVW